MTISQRLFVFTTVVIGIVTTLMAVAVYGLTAWNLDATLDRTLIGRIERFHHVWQSISDQERPLLFPADQLPVPAIRAFVDDSRRKQVESELEFVAPRFVRKSASKDLPLGI